MVNAPTDLDLERLAVICERYGVARLDVFGVGGLRWSVAADQSDTR